jgi:uncharacterized membrane-anchored protein
MTTKSIYALLLTGLISSYSCQAQEQQVKSREELLKLANSLVYKDGEITLRGGLAKLEVPKGFKYLGPADANTVLSKMWGNPPNDQSLGLLLPADTSPLDRGCWAVIISYTEDGYVKDNDATKINYDDLLKKMQKQVRDASGERAKQGYDTVELVGWATPPHYDAATHKLYWAKDLRFGQSPHDTLNYNIRILGRRGVLVLNAVASVSQLDEIEKLTPQILTMVNFNDGNRYADFNPKVDKVATYGIAALVAGGIAAKLGLFKLIWVFLLAAKKFVIIGAIAVSTWFKKLFSKNKRTEATAPPAPGPTVT